MTRHLIIVFLVLISSISFAGDDQTINGPIIVRDVWIARDGGTISIRFQDAKEKLFEVCRDERLNFSPHYTYIGAMYPTGKKAVKIEHGAPEEKLLVNLLLEWVSKNENQLEHIDQNYRKEIILKVNMIKRFVSLILETKS